MLTKKPPQKLYIEKTISCTLHLPYLFVSFLHPLTLIVKLNEEISISQSAIINVGLSTTIKEQTFVNTQQLLAKFSSRW